MRIGLDLQTVGRARTGDETYYRALARHLPQQAPEHTYQLYYTAPEAEPFLQSLPASCRAQKLSFSSPWLRIPLAYRLAMRAHPVDVFHTQYVGFALSPAKLVLTIHDLSYELYPETFSRSRAWLLKATRYCAKQAAAIIVVSESTRHDLERLYGIPREKIHVVYNAAADHFRPATDPQALKGVREKYGLRDRYILSVGAQQPRKNIRRLMEAYQAARQQPGFDAQLVLVGPPAWGDVALPQGTDRDAIRWTGYVPDADLPLLYSGAVAFAYPSLYEGFGLPVLEAMACGVPVLTSNRSSLPEIAGDAAAYVDPERTASITEMLVRLTADGALQNTLRQKGLQRARQFSWQKAAQQTLEVYQHAVVS